MTSMITSTIAQQSPPHPLPQHQVTPPITTTSHTSSMIPKSKSHSPSSLLSYFTTRLNRTTPTTGNNGDQPIISSYILDENSRPKSTLLTPPQPTLTSHIPTNDLSPKSILAVLNYLSSPSANYTSLELVVLAFNFLRFLMFDELGKSLLSSMDDGKVKSFGVRKVLLHISTVLCSPQPGSSHSSSSSSSSASASVAPHLSFDEMVMIISESPSTTSITFLCGLFKATTELYTTHFHTFPPQYARNKGNALLANLVEYHVGSSPALRKALVTPLETGSLNAQSEVVKYTTFLLRLSTSMVVCMSSSSSSSSSSTSSDVISTEGLDAMISSMATLYGVVAAVEIDSDHGKRLVELKSRLVVSFGMLLNVQSAANLANIRKLSGVVNRLFCSSSSRCDGELCIGLLVFGNSIVKRLTAYFKGEGASSSSNVGSNAQQQQNKSIEDSKRLELEDLIHLTLHNTVTLLTYSYPLLAHTHDEYILPLISLLQALTLKLTNEGNSKNLSFQAYAFMCMIELGNFEVVPYNDEVRLGVLTGYVQLSYISSSSSSSSASSFSNVDKFLSFTLELGLHPSCSAQLRIFIATFLQRTIIFSSFKNNILSKLTSAVLSKDSNVDHGARVDFGVALGRCFECCPIDNDTQLLIDSIISFLREGLSLSLSAPSMHNSPSTLNVIYAILSSGGNELLKLVMKVDQLQFIITSLSSNLQSHNPNLSQVIKPLLKLLTLERSLDTQIFKYPWTYQSLDSLLDIFHQLQQQFPKSEVLIIVTVLMRSIPSHTFHLPPPSKRVLHKKLISLLPPLFTSTHWTVQLSAIIVLAPLAKAFQINQDVEMQTLIVGSLPRLFKAHFRARIEGVVLKIDGSCGTLNEDVAVEVERGLIVGLEVDARRVLGEKLKVLEDVGGRGGAGLRTLTIPKTFKSNTLMVSNSESDEPGVVILVKKKLTEEQIMRIGEICGVEGGTIADCVVGSLDGEITIVLQG